MGSVTKVDWSWKGESSTYKKPRTLSAKQKKKIANRARSNMLSRARARAKAITGNLALGNSNRDLANALAAMGKLKGGPYGKKGARTALSAWYERTPVETKPEKVNLPTPEVFYSSREWRDIRYKALMQQGRQCQCCGAKPPAVVLHVDHIKPRSLYPELELELSNLQILCEDCNLGKSNKDDTDFR